MSLEPRVAPLSLPAAQYYDTALCSPAPAPRRRTWQAGALLALLGALLALLQCARHFGGHPWRAGWVLRPAAPVGVVTLPASRLRRMPLRAMEDRPDNDPLKGFARGFGRRARGAEDAADPTPEDDPLANFAPRSLVDHRRPTPPVPKMRDYLLKHRLMRYTPEAEPPQQEYGFTRPVAAPARWELEPEAEAEWGEPSRAGADGKAAAEATEAEEEEEEDGEEEGDSDGEDRPPRGQQWPAMPRAYQRAGEGQGEAEGEAADQEESALTIYSVADVPVPRNALDLEVLRDDWTPPQKHNGKIPYFRPPRRPPFEHLQWLPEDTVIPLPRLDDVAPDRTNLTGLLPRAQIRKPITTLRVRPNGKVSAGQYRVTNNHMAREVTDQRIRDLITRAVRDLTVYFFEDKRSPFWKLAGPTVHLFRNDEVFIEKAVAIEFPERWAGLDTLPSKFAWAMYTRGTPIGVATILDRLVDFGDCLEVAIFFKPEHESVRSTMLGRGKRTHKLLRGFLEQQLTVMMQMRINLHVGVVPLVGWSKKVGGINYFTVEDVHVPGLSFQPRLVPPRDEVRRLTGSSRAP
eukprot:EG_transcript_7385